MTSLTALTEEVKNLNYFKEEHPKLVETIAHLETRIQSSLPRKQVLSGFCLGAFFCLIAGVGLGANLNQSSSR